MAKYLCAKYLLSNKIMFFHKMSWKYLNLFYMLWETFCLQIQGAVMLSSLFQIFVGFTGLVGVLLRFIGPITVAPTIALVGLSLFAVCSDFAGKKRNLF
jgi:xanthine/uracil permease